MNTTLALRLLWKEYRMQRGLWLAMAFGCVLIQFVISIVTPQGEMAFQAAVPLSLLLTFFYTMGSGAMTFAIEREEATQIRPVMMGCPPGLTLSVKFIFGIVATLLLVTATGLSGLLLTQGNLQLPPIPIRPDAPPLFVPVLIAALILPFVGALLWSMFFSLVTRTVILALGLSTIAMIFTYGILISDASLLTDRHSAQPTTFEVASVSALLIVGTLFLLVVNYFLTYRWLTHVFFDQRTVRSPSLLRRFRLSRYSVDGGVTVEIGGEDRTAYEVLDPKMAVLEPPPRFGLSLLHSLWGPNRWRHLRFLRWKEAFETRKLFLLFFLGAVLLIMASGVRNTNDGAFVVTGYSSIVCLCCGVMAFRKEQYDRLFLKLADMGLNPRTVWFSKHLVWLVRAFFCCFFLILFSIIFGLAPPRAPDHLIAAVILGRAIIGILTVYGIGQLCSLLIRSAIVSVFVAFVVALLAFAWAMVCARLEVSWTLSVLPLAVGCFLVTWFRVRPWTLDDKRPQTWLLPLCSIVAAVAIAYTGTWLYRVHEVPWVAPLYADSTASLADPAVKRGPLTAKEEETFSLYRRAAELLPATSDEVRRSVRELIATAVASPECAEFSADDCDMLMLQDSKARGIFVDVLREVISVADEKNADEDFEGALEQYEIAFVVARHSAGRGDWSSFHQCHELTNTVLSAIQAWAAAEAADESLLERAIALIDEHREKLATPEAVNYFSSMAIRNTLDGDVLAMSQLVRGPEERMVMALSMEFPGERPRGHRVLNQIESYQNEITATYRNQLNGLRGTGRGIYRFPNLNSAERIIAAEASEQMHRWLQTTPSVSFLASASSDINCKRDLDTECEVRATKVLLLLLIERQTRNTYPETLKDFDVSLNNPRTDRPFTWYPQGLDKDLIGNSGVLVAARTPFLLSANPGSNPVVVVPDPNAVIESEMGFGSMEMMGGFSEADDVAAIPEEERPPLPTVYRLNVPHSRHGFPEPKIWTLPAETLPE